MAQKLWTTAVADDKEKPSKVGKGQEGCAWIIQLWCFILGSFIWRVYEMILQKWTWLDLWYSKVSSET